MVPITTLILTAMLGYVIIGTCAADTIDIAAWNIKTFGASKMGNDTLASIIADVCLEYDLIVIQEIRDISGWSIDELLYRLQDVDQAFRHVCSSRLGRTSYKEQYCFYWRSDHLKLIGSYLFDDEYDDFERQPFVCVFRPVACNYSSDFAVTTVHVKPADAVTEVTMLHDVMADLMDRLSWVQKAFIIGDLNAGCSYLNVNNISNEDIYNSTKYNWLIDFNADTTVSTNTECPYDRIIAIGNSTFVENSTVIFDFGVFFNLSQPLAYAVSDHYPVEFKINATCAP